jgi:hypothetical protein
MSLFKQISSGIGAMLGIDTSEMTEVEIAQALEDAKLKTETAEQAQEAQTQESELTEQVDANYIERLNEIEIELSSINSTLDTIVQLDLGALKADIESVAGLLSKMTVASKTDTSKSTKVDAVAAIETKVKEVESETKSTPLSLNEFGKVSF